MGKSKKKNLISKSGRWMKDLYWGIVRSNWKQELRVNPTDPVFENKNAIINQYDHCDYIHMGCTDDCYCMKRYGRKRCFDK